MYEAFPSMRSLHFQSATGPTECQDLLGLDFRTAALRRDGQGAQLHPTGSLGCDMTPAYL